MYWLYHMYVYYLLQLCMCVHKKLLQRGYKMATENALGVYINPISSWKYVEHIYYMTVQLSPLSLNLFCLVPFIYTIQTM